MPPIPIAQCANCDQPIQVQRESFGDVWVHRHTKQMLCHPNALGSTTHAEPKR